MRHKLRTALTLSLRDWWTLLQAGTLLTLADLGLRVLPFRWLQRAAASGAPPAERAPPAGTTSAVRRLDRLLDIAVRYHPLHPRCLTRSLVLQWLLARRGIPAELRIGVRKEGPDLRAHAWLVHQGQPIGRPGAASTGYAPLNDSGSGG